MRTCTRTRMRRGAAAALTVSALFFAAACGGASDKDGDTGKGTDGTKDKAKETSAASAPLTAAQMTAAALTAADLPKGWQDDELAKGTNETYKADKAECQPLADFMGDEITGATKGSDKDFKDAAGTSQFSQQVFTYAGTGAADFAKAVGTALGTCTAFSAEMEGNKIDLKVEKLAAPAGGDEAHAFRLKMEMPSLGGMKIELNMMTIAQGTGMTRVAHVPSDASGHTAWDDLAKRAGDKFVKGAQS